MDPPGMACVLMWGQGERRVGRVRPIRWPAHEPRARLATEALALSWVERGPSDDRETINRRRPLWLGGVTVRVPRAPAAVGGVANAAQRRLSPARSSRCCWHSSACGSSGAPSPRPGHTVPPSQGPAGYCRPGGPPRAPTAQGRQGAEMCRILNSLGSASDSCEEGTGPTSCQLSWGCLLPAAGKNIKSTDECKEPNHKTCFKRRVSVFVFKIGS